MSLKIFFATMMLVAGAGCMERRSSGPLERVGERSDEIIDNAKEGKPLLHRKGALEKAGESIDRTLGNDNR
jgi:hypothetical protein